MKRSAKKKAVKEKLNGGRFRVAELRVGNHHGPTSEMKNASGKSAGL
jgi:hypothetical protein